MALIGCDTNNMTPRRRLLVVLAGVFSLFFATFMVQEYRLAHMQPSKRLCVIAMMKEEQENIEEWALALVAQGVDHIYAWDDNSVYPYPETLNILSDAGFLTIVHGTWFTPRQMWVYMLMSMRARLDGYHWIMSIDLDEMPIASDHCNVGSALDGTSRDVIAMPFLIFGSSGHIESTPNMLASYVKRANMNGKALEVDEKKIVARLGKIWWPAVHNVASGAPAYVLNHTQSIHATDWLQMEEHPPSLALAHFRVQSQERWEKRSQIGRATKNGWKGQYRTLERFQEFDRNDVVDERIKTFALKAMPSWYTRDTRDTIDLRARAFQTSFDEVIRFREGCNGNALT